MIYTFSDFVSKEVINIKTGIKIGYVDDMEIHYEDACVKAIIVYGRKKLFGLLGREDDIIIRWKDIEIIGEDTILVSYDEEKAYRRKNASFFGNFNKK